MIKAKISISGSQCHPKTDEETKQHDLWPPQLKGTNEIQLERMRHVMLLRISQGLTKGSRDLCVFLMLNSCCHSDRRFSSSWWPERSQLTELSRVLTSAAAAAAILIWWVAQSTQLLEWFNMSAVKFRSIIYSKYMLVFIKITVTLLQNMLCVFGCLPFVRMMSEPVVYWLVMWLTNCHTYQGCKKERKKDNRSCSAALV